MTNFERVVRHIIARNQKTIDQLLQRNGELQDAIVAQRTGVGTCPVCVAENYAGIDALIYHDNAHVWPDYAG